MRQRELTGRALAAIAALALGLGAATAASAQDQTAQDQTAQGQAAQDGAAEQFGNGDSLSSGVPIIAPVTVDGGESVNVVVDGAAEGSRIELWGPIGEPGAASQLAAAPLTGGVAALTAPEMSGSYQLRYIDGSGNQLGRRAFDVAAVPVALTVATPVGVGGVLEVTWQGPARPGDRFEIVSASGAVVGSAPAAGNPSGENVSPITAPAEPGTYELSYVTDRGAVLRAVRFDVR